MNTNRSRILERLFNDRSGACAPQKESRESGCKQFLHCTNRCALGEHEHEHEKANVIAS